MLTAEPWYTVLGDDLTVKFIVLECAKILDSKIQKYSTHTLGGKILALLKEYFYRVISAVSYLNPPLWGKIKKYAISLYGRKHNQGYSLIKNDGVLKK